MTEYDLMITNWSGTYTAAQVAARPRLVSCSPQRDAPPIPGAERTLIGMQACATYYKNKLIGSPGEFLYDVADEARRNGYDLLPVVLDDGRVVQRHFWTTQEANGTTTYALNLSRRVVGTWFAQKVYEHFPLFHGWHLDYCTPLAFVRNEWQKNGVAGGQAFWNAYMDGMRYMLHRYRTLRGTRPTTIIGQQWHNNRGEIDCYNLDGRFIELGPWYWHPGGKPWQVYHREQMDDFASFQRYPGAHAPEHVIEFRYTTQDAAYQPALLNFVESSAHDIVLSWGREQAAGVGFPL